MAGNMHASGVGLHEGYLPCDAQHDAWPTANASDGSTDAGVQTHLTQAPDCKAQWFL